MADQPQRQREPPAKLPRAMLPYLLFLLVLFAVLHTFIRGPGGLEISYTEFKQHLAAERIAEVVFRGSEIAGRFHEAQPLGATGLNSERFVTRLPPLSDDELLPELERQKVQVLAESDPAWPSLLYLRNPEKFRRLGARIPRGVLLMGPPGTGKTLLARALAGEAQVPFFSISGSEFIEVFVGVGAARVRNLFEAAKRQAPCMVFIDELDAVGRTRGTGLGGGHDEREQTLNQILAEMDGFAPHEALIVLAATNRPDVLDPALLRPGRFDRHVVLDLPDRKDREAILAVHSRGVPLAPDTDLREIAATTRGFSGADLKNLVNEAAILAAREDQPFVARRHLGEARDKVILGAARSLALQPEERHRLAVHEAGHTVVAYHLPHADPLYKVSIIPRGRTLGGTQQLAEQERHTLPEDYLRDRLAVLLAGRTAECKWLGTVSSGADDDIRQATALARSMVARWGMSTAIGPVDLRDSEEHPFLGREIAQPRRFSESSAQAVDQAVRRLLNDAEERALKVLAEHGPDVERLARALEEEENLERSRIEPCSVPDHIQCRRLVRRSRFRIPLQRNVGRFPDAPPPRLRPASI